MVSILDFLLIGDSKTKIVLNREEVEKYHLDSGENTPLARRSLWRILDMAKAEVGFNVSGDKVLIQIYPRSDGGCELFVTKLGLLPESSARLVARSDKISLLSRTNAIYLFESVEDLIASSKAVARVTKLPLNSDVYYDGKRYFLTVEEYGRSGESLEFPCILEFAVCLCSDMLAYISEHAERLTDGDGIDKFSKI